MGTAVGKDAEKTAAAPQYRFHRVRDAAATPRNPSAAGKLARLRRALRDALKRA